MFHGRAIVRFAPILRTPMAGSCRDWEKFLPITYVKNP